MNIKKFSVSKLFGHKDIELDILDNKIIIVGVNGLGKTAVLNLLYFFISSQWVRMLDYEFDNIALFIDRRKLVVSRVEIEALQIERRYRVEVDLPISLQRRLSEIKRSDSILWDSFSSSKPLDLKNLKRLSDKLGISTSGVDRLRADFMRSLTQENNNLSKAESYLRHKLEGEVILYMPTYRRIEKEFEAVFPDLMEQLRRYSKTDTPFAARSKEHFAELAQFGMEDVRANIDKTLDSLKETARKSLNNLAASYLRDVIRGEAATFNPQTVETLLNRVADKYYGELQKLPECTDRAHRDALIVAKLLDRVEEETLSEEDKKQLLDVILHIKKDEKPSDKDRYIAHYFSKLVQVIEGILDKERSIAGFVTVCSRYLSPKSISYNESKYKLTIYDNKKNPIDLRMLSSGEKQVVSIFSHLYLTQDKRYMVIIDEPELSLSVDWQTTLLPDIIHSNNCSFLAAVTHSPFVFDNELDPHAVDLSLCVSEETK